LLQDLAGALHVEGPPIPNPPCSTDPDNIQIELTAGWHLSPA